MNKRELEELEMLEEYEPVIEAPKLTDSHIQPGMIPPEIIEEPWERKGGLLVETPLSPDYKLIEQALWVIESSEGLPYEDDGALAKGVSKRFARNIPLLVKTIKHLVQFEEPHDVFSPRVTMALEIVRRHLATYDDLDVPRATVIRNYAEGKREVTIGNQVNAIVAKIRSELKNKEFRKKEAQWRGRYYKRMKAADRYLDGKFKKFPKMLFVRVDLHPAKIDPNEALLRAGENWQASTVQLQELNKKVLELLNKMRSKKLFKSLIGHILKLEYAPDRGWHAHMLFLFNGQEVWNDSYYSVKIGIYWRDVITKGEGTYFPLNTAENKKKYRCLGIGMIHRSDGDAREILLKKVVSYLAKSDLFLQSKSFKGQKLFRTGRAESD